MMVMGRPPHCVRILPRRNGCEVRFSGRVLFGNKDLAMLLEFICGDPNGEQIGAFSSVLQVGPEVARGLIEDSLCALAKAGIPRHVWGDGWQGESQASRASFCGAQSEDGC